MFFMSLCYFVTVQLCHYNHDQMLYQFVNMSLCRHVAMSYGIIVVHVHVMLVEIFHYFYYGVVFVDDAFVVKSCTATNYAADDDVDDANIKELKLLENG